MSGEDELDRVSSMTQHAWAARPKAMDVMDADARRTGDGRRIFNRSGLNLAAGIGWGGCEGVTERTCPGRKPLAGWCLPWLTRRGRHGSNAKGRKDAGRPDVTLIFII